MTENRNKTSESDVSVTPDVAQPAAERDSASVPALASGAPERDARPAATDTPSADPIDVSRVAKAGLRPVKNHPNVGRDEHGVIRSLDPDRFDAATRAAVDAFVESLLKDAGGAERTSARTRFTINAAGRAYGMVLRLNAVIERAGAVASNGRVRASVTQLGEWEDRLATLLRSLPDPPRPPVDPRDALRRAVEDAKAERR